MLAARNAYAGAQWLADQGFCVVIADGRGTPGQSPAWEHSIAGNLRDAALEDQVAALERGRCVPGRRGSFAGGDPRWSYGGYLAALAVLQRPDVFTAAIAGAPVTEWRLYDTAYTERYLGDPAPPREAYDHSSLLPLAGDLERPLLVIHGLADDNVFAPTRCNCRRRWWRPVARTKCCPVGVTHDPNPRSPRTSCSSRSGLLPHLATKAE